MLVNDASVKAKVMGIYATALTKLLLDHDFQIVEPSDSIKNGLGLTDNFSRASIKVKDRNNLQGVIVLGDADTVENFKEVLHKTLLDVITRKCAVEVNAIYKGEIVSLSEDTVYVDIGNDILGQLPRSGMDFSKGEAVLVQVEGKRIRTKHPFLTTNLKIIGRFALLTRNKRVGVSLKIHDLKKRAELYDLGKKLASESWGVIWREKSAKQTKEALENEVKMLMEKAKLLMEKAQSAEAPSLLFAGSSFMDVEFPFFSKEKLDQIRACVAPTWQRHHFYKSCGGKAASAVEMAEKILEKGQSINAINEAFTRQISSEFPEKNSIVNVEHVKPSGAVFNLGPAKIEYIDDKRLKFKRIMRSNGFYNGLNVKKETRDKAISETEIGELFIETSYYSISDELKGKYININTPVEVYPEAIRYVDLEVDVCILPDGSTKVLDMEKLEKILAKGFISKTLYQKIVEKVEEIKRVHEPK